MGKRPKTNRFVLLIGIVSLFLSHCTSSDSQVESTQTTTQVKQAICPKSLSYAECPNSPAMHGQVMVHNMTDKSYEVKVEHHENVFETKRIAPGDGWTFVGVIQGKRLLIAEATMTGNAYEGNCMVMGNGQHTMNITSSGFVMAISKESKEGKKDRNKIKIPIRKESGH